jgi:hypothetical protein
MSPGSDPASAGRDATSDAVGVYRRRVRLAACGRVAVGALEDDIHHVRVTIRHDGTRVTGAAGEAVRLPWSTCPGSEAGIGSLVGTELAAASRGLRDAYDRAIHCTHMFDLAQLVVAHAARGTDEERDYLATVDADRAVIARDGELLLSWTVRPGDLPAMPGDPALGEAAFILRRAVYLAPISSMHFDDYDTVGPTGLPVGSCWTAQPERIGAALRHRGSQRRYADAPGSMTAGFEEYRDASFAG